MPEYIIPPLEVQADTLANEAYAYLEDRIDGWLPSPGNLEAWLIESLAQLGSETANLASTVPTSIFRYYGTTLLNFPPHPAIPSIGETTWTVADTSGYLIPQGTLLGIPASGSDLLTFSVNQDTVVPEGSNTVSAVGITAMDATADGNSLTDDPELIDSLDWVVSITLDAPTHGGADAESDEDYLARLRELLQLLSPRPILPRDFAILAKTIDGVGRATAIDLYNADTSTAGVERCVTVVVTDASGEPCTTEVKDEVQAMLEAEREINFLVFVVDADYTEVDVDFTFEPYPDYDGASVAVAAVDAVTQYLEPANFGALPYGGTRPEWLPDSKIRYLEIAEVINRVDGVNFITALTVAGGTTDVTLPGIAPLPRPGTITGDAI